MAISKIITGARTVVYVNGLIYGRCTGMSWESTTPRREIMTCDIQWPQELASTTIHVKGSLKVLRLSGDGGAQGAQVIAPPTQLSTEKYFNLQVIDRATGITLFNSDLCACEAEAWEVDARGRLEGRISFTAILWENSDG